MSPPATPGAVWLGAATLALVLHAAEIGRASCRERVSFTV